MCQYCDKNNILIEIMHEVNNTIYFAKVNFNIKEKDKSNEIDLEVGYSIREVDDNGVIQVKETHSTHSDVIPVNFCSYCGKVQKAINTDYVDVNSFKMNKEGKYVILDHVFQNLDGILLLDFKNKKLELQLLMDNQIIEKQYSIIKFYFTDGVKIAAKDNTINDIMNLFEKYVQVNKTFVKKNLEVSEKCFVGERAESLKTKLRDIIENA